MAHGCVRFAGRGLLVLTLINLLNYLDRFVPVGGSAADEGLGHRVHRFPARDCSPPGFLIVYMLAAPAFGYLGDRRSRTRPIAIGVALWSLATVWSGLARSYWELFASRAAVGIGEAAYATISPGAARRLLPASAARPHIRHLLHGHSRWAPRSAMWWVGRCRRPGAGGPHSWSRGYPDCCWRWACCGVPDPPRGASEAGALAPMLPQTRPGVLGALRRTLRAVSASLRGRVPMR